jgi:hypothetical protein
MANPLSMTDVIHMALENLSSNVENLQPTSSSNSVQNSTQFAYNGYIYTQKNCYTKKTNEVVQIYSCNKKKAQHCAATIKCITQPNGTKEYICGQAQHTCSIAETVGINIVDVQNEMKVLLFILTVRTC